jgi:DNA-binding MarR family transcriptional regulator
METIFDTDLNQLVPQFADLIQNLILLRPRLIVPEQMLHFREEMERLKCGNIGDKGDYQAIMRIFVILAHLETPPTMSELSAKLNVPFSTATRVVDWLVQGNFVERLPDPGDRRIIRVRMTPTGQEFSQIAFDFIHQRILHLLKIFTPDEQVELYRLLSKLVSALSREEYPGI